MSSALRELAGFASGISLAVAPSRIAVLQALRMGDLLCTTPALRAIRRRYPRSEITLIGLPSARELAERLPSIDRFVPFTGFPGIAEPVMGGPAPVMPVITCDLAIQMHGSGNESNSFVAALGARYCVGYGPASEQRLTARLDWIEDEPEPLRWLRLVSALGARPDGLRLDLPITVPEQQKAAVLLGPADGRPVIGLHVGASETGRRWPVDAFAALADRLAERLDARIVLTGSLLDQPLTAQVRHAMQTEATLIDLAGLTTLGEFAAVVAALDLLVTNDTGASQIAAAMRTRSVILFGPTQPHRWAPLDLTRHHLIDAAPEGSPAEGAAALRTLSPELVAARCAAALRESHLASDCLTTNASLERIA